MITLQKAVLPGILGLIAVFATACSSPITAPSVTTDPVQPAGTRPELSSNDAVQIALAASQRLYENLRSLGAVGVTASRELEPRTNLSGLDELFGESVPSPSGTAGAWLVEVQLEMIGAPANSGTSFTLYAIDAANGRILSRATSPVRILPVNG